MSFRDVAVRREDGAALMDLPGRGPKPRGYMVGRNPLAVRNKRHTNAEEPSPSGGLLYSQMRLVPSSSCESSSKSHADEDTTPLHESISSCSFQESLSLNSNNSPPRKRTSNPQSGSWKRMSNPQSGSASRGTPGFSTHRRQRHHGGGNGIPAWTRGPARHHVHTTAASTTRRSSRKAMPQPNNANPQQAAKDTESELSTEIRHFQRMVVQLEHMIECSSDSPENQWKSRILVRSAQEADRDIADKLFLYEQDLVDKGRSRAARTAQAACMKLHRDYRRAHKALDDTLLEQQRRQQADISMLLGPAMLLQQEQEDFFERATREREEEIKKISHKMQQVNDIYEELAALVDGQQEQIDAVEENIHAAESSVNRGLKHIEFARDRLCVMGDDGYEVPRCGGMEDVEGQGSRPKQRGKETNPRSRKEPETFNWSAQLQNFQKDIMELGNDLASSLGCTFTENMECGFGNSSVYDEGESSSLVG